MIESSSGHNLVEQIAGEFLERRRRGEKATIAEYCAKYPDQAEEIRSVLGTIELVENLKPAPEDAGAGRSRSGMPPRAGHCAS